MRSELILLLLAISVLCVNGEPPVARNVIFSATESQLREWASGKALPKRFLKIKGGGKEVIVILVEAGSGVVIEHIYVYFLERDEWHLCLLRPTNGSVEVENLNKALVFRNSKGTVLVELPFASMRLAIE